ncbi:MAG: SLATT domain-containing protein [Chloroflexi bacterium]|nr:SLATT domain-containing protein [Chloroflexota bacterium]
MTNTRELIIKEAKKVEEDSVYSSRGHFVAASFWGTLRLGIGIPTAVLSATAGAIALSQLDNSNTIAAILAFTATALVALATFLNPDQRANSHLHAGNRYNALRNEARIFYEIEAMARSSEQKRIDKLKELSKRRDDLNETSPQISRLAYKIAKRRITRGEADYDVGQV